MILSHMQPFTMHLASYLAQSIISPRHAGAGITKCDPARGDIMCDDSLQLGCYVAPALFNIYAALKAE